MNMPTPTAQITGSYTSGIRYDSFQCPRLAVELDALSRREGQLVIAQEQRIKTSQMQAFWWGFGQGDGLEAAELASIRGEKEAVIKAMQVKSCAMPALPPLPTQLPTPTRFGNHESTGCSQGAMPC